jgi:hypothetical protein
LIQVNALSIRSQNRLLNTADDLKVDSTKREIALLQVILMLSIVLTVLNLRLVGKSLIQVDALSIRSQIRLLNTANDSKVDSTRGKIGLDAPPFPTSFDSCNTLIPNCEYISALLIELLAVSNKYISGAVTISRGEILSFT